MSSSKYCFTILSYDRFDSLIVVHIMLSGVAVVLSKCASEGKILKSCVCMFKIVVLRYLKFVSCGTNLLINR